MLREEFTQQYDSNLPLYTRLSTMVTSTVTSLLKGAAIPYLNVDGRLKTLESSFEKSTRKNYDDPFDQIEDFCGIRVICYYPADVDKIVTLLGKEFSVLSKEDTMVRMKPNEFGYRSTHLIISIPKDWLKAPQYRGLDNLKAELQIRTVLMHAWAEIQHKLAYKSLEQVPDAFQRRLFRLSAKFEEADEQLEQIRDDLAAYRAEITPNTGEGISSLKGQPLNLDTLTVLLNKAYPDRSSSVERNSELLAELSETSIEMDGLIEAIEKVLPFLGRLEEETYGIAFRGKWLQVGAARNTLDVANETYFRYRLNQLSATDNQTEWLEHTEFGRRLLRNPTS
jgi:putative GTP pyrophosphokinase